MVSPPLFRHLVARSPHPVFRHKTGDATMRGSIVVLALAISPFVARVSMAQGHSHVRRHDLPAGSYTICVLAPAGWNQVFPTSGPACAVGIGYSQDAPALAGDVLFDGVDFGFVSAHW